MRRFLLGSTIWLGFVLCVVAAGCGTTDTSADVTTDDTNGRSDAFSGVGDTRDRGDSQVLDPPELPIGPVDLGREPHPDIVNSDAAFDLPRFDDSIAPPVDVADVHLEISIDAGPDDMDDDGVLDRVDNCPGAPNPGQENMDGDKKGDACDPDKDGDFLVDVEDNCPDVSNSAQSDIDGDGLGDPCDSDSDGDGFANDEDNCPLSANGSQADFDDDGYGDSCDPDDDGDGVPDVSDEAPLDANWPGLAIDGAIYAHTSSSLYRFDSVLSIVETVGVFGFPNGGQSMTDIAIDYEGHIFGVSFSNLYRCSAVSAECIHLGGLPSSFNGMTIVPVGTIEPGKESMIGIGNSGTWNEISVVGNQATITQLGTYGAGYTSAGDAYSIEGIGTFAAVNKVGASSTYLVTVDPAGGSVTEEIGPMTGYSNIYGLASDGETAFAFDSSGAILALDVLTGNTTVALPPGQGKSWWGAGVTTRYFNKD